MKVENKTIIITDPCYIVKKLGKEANPHPFPYNTEFFYSHTQEEIKEAYKIYNDWNCKHNDWIKSEYGNNMEVLGIRNYIIEDTLCGDWSCNTYEQDTNKLLGKFCADSGRVGIFVLDEVLAYNPDVKNWIDTHDWCVTTIENFTGEITIKAIQYPRYSDNLTDVDLELRIIGTGSTNFYTTSYE